MMLKEAFKVGFLARLAEYGVAPSEVEMHMQLEKCALFDGAITAILENAPMVALGVPILGGMLSGRIHSELTKEPEDSTKRLLKAQRLNAIREQSEKLKYQIRRMKRDKAEMGDDAQRGVALEV